jgi:hypothetical protein
MSYFESILEHNKDLAAQQSAAGAQMPSLPAALPNVKAIIIGCADMRGDPAHVFGFKPGEAVNLRLRESVGPELSIRHFYPLQTRIIRNDAPTNIGTFSHVICRAQ